MSRIKGYIIFSMWASKVTWSFSMFALSVTLPSLWTSSPLGNYICSVSAAVCCTTWWSGTWHISSLLMNVFKAPVSTIQRLWGLQTVSINYAEYLWHSIACWLPQMGACLVYWLSDIHSVRGTSRGVKVTKLATSLLWTILCVMAYLATVIAINLW